MQFHVGRQLLDHVPLQETPGQMLKDLIEEAAEVDLEPKPASLSWTSTYASEDMEDMILGTLKGLLQISLGRRIQDTGMDDES